MVLRKKVKHQKVKVIGINSTCNLIIFARKQEKLIGFFDMIGYENPVIH